MCTYVQMHLQFGALPFAHGMIVFDRQRVIVVFATATSTTLFRADVLCHCFALWEFSWFTEYAKCFTNYTAI